MISNRLLRIKQRDTQRTDDPSKIDRKFSLNQNGKLDHFWSRLKGVKYFIILDTRSGFITFQYIQIPDQKELLLVHMKNSNGNE